jgi:hypothetical protein
MIKPCIDKTSITMEEEKEDPHHKDAIRETMFHFAKPGYFPFAKHGRISAKGGRYEAALRIHSPNLPGDIQGPWSTEFAFLQCNPKNGQGGFLRLEWNPAKWSPSAKAHLFGTISAVMLHPANFDQLLADAKVTRLDVALDVPGIRPDDYLWELKKGVYRSSINKGGNPETLYLGNLKAAKGGIRVYDKGAEMGVPSLKLTRIAIGTTLMAVEATSWNDLQARYAMQRIDHQVATACQAASTQASGRVILPTAASRDRTPPSHRGHPSNQVSAGVGLARGSSSREQWAADPCHHGAGDGGSSVGGLMQVLATVRATNLESGNINQVQIRNT